MLVIVWQQPKLISNYSTYGHYPLARTYGIGFQCVPLLQQGPLHTTNLTLRKKRYPLKKEKSRRGVLYVQICESTYICLSNFRLGFSEDYPFRLRETA